VVGVLAVVLGHSSTAGSATGTMTLGSTPVAAASPAVASPRPRASLPAAGPRPTVARRSAKRTAAGSYASVQASSSVQAGMLTSEAGNPADTSPGTAYPASQALGDGAGSAGAQRGWNQPYQSWQGDAPGTGQQPSGATGWEAPGPQWGRTSDGGYPQGGGGFSQGGGGHSR
jgi:hypothetical protein